MTWKQKKIEEEDETHALVESQLTRFHLIPQGIHLKELPRCHQRFRGRLVHKNNTRNITFKEIENVRVI